MRQAFGQSAKPDSCPICSKLRRIAYTHAGGCHAWHSCGWTLWRDAPFGHTGADSRNCMCSCFL